MPTYAEWRKAMESYTPDPWIAAIEDHHSALVVTVDHHDGRGPVWSMSVPSGRLAGYPEARARGYAEALAKAPLPRDPARRSWCPVSGPLGVRRGNPAQRWTIVHVVSGLIVLRGYRSQVAALRELDHVTGLADWSRSADALLADPAVRSRMADEQVRVAHGRPIPAPPAPEFDQGRPAGGEMVGDPMVETSMVGGPMVETSMIIEGGEVDHDQRRPASESIGPGSINAPDATPAPHRPRVSAVTRDIAARADMRVRATHSAERVRPGVEHADQARPRIAERNST